MQRPLIQLVKHEATLLLLIISSRLNSLPVESPSFIIIADAMMQKPTANKTIGLNIIIRIRFPIISAPPWKTCVPKIGSKSSRQATSRVNRLK